MPELPIALVLRMAWRETRGAWRQFVYFLVCITLGVGALVGVGSFAESLERTVGRSARSLMGADVEIRGTRPLFAEAETVVSRLKREGIGVTRVRELVAMAQSGSPRAGATPPPTQLVELKAVEAGYPFYGRLVAEPDQPLASLIGGGRALVHESLLARLGLQVGDRLAIGRSEFTVSGVIRTEPDRSAGVFSLGPRVLIAGEDLDRTGLVLPGSRIRYRTLLRLPEGRSAEAFRDDLAERLSDAALRITAYTQAQPGLRRFWGQLTMYLGLTGLVALMVGGIGVAVSVSAFVRSKLPTIAVLKCLGAGWREILAVYALQTALLGLVGSLLGAALGSALQPLLAPFLARLLPIEVELGASPIAILRGLAMGVGVTMLYALWPLLEIRRVPPALILRHEVEPALVGRRPWPAAGVIAVGLAALALWQAGSWKIGGLFIGGLLAALLLLALGSRLVIRLARRIRWRGLAWRQGTANLYRPGSQAGAVMVSLGLAVMLMVSVALLEGTLREQITRRSPERAPAFFFIDIQPDQAEPFADLVGRISGTRPELVPVVRSRLAAINGVPVATSVRAGREDVWYLTREYVLTWAAEPPGHNTIVAGRWWSPSEAQREALISVEEEIAGQLGVGLGGTLTFDVQGVPVTARVVNLRRVDWQSLNSNFFVIFSPGALDGAPTTFLATARARPEDESRVQAAVVAAFSNVTAIPVREVLERVAGVLDQIALAIRLVAAFSLLSGLVVMTGALSVTRRQRLYQSVILKALGATRGFVARVFAAEYVLLGAAAGFTGTALAVVLAWALLRFAFDVAWQWEPAVLAVGVTAAAALALVVGLLGTRRLLGRRPLSVLRSE
ncbi:MAG TPA: FtsX-like permease family protein [Methylomirabilota bacterium]|nr:FtsX-like permease family protein [Methylomirabilota bacterium]